MNRTPGALMLLLDALHRLAVISRLSALSLALLLPTRRWLRIQAYLIRNIRLITRCLVCGRAASGFLQRRAWLMALLHMCALLQTVHSFLAFLAPSARVRIAARLRN